MTSQGIVWTTKEGQ